VAKIFISYQRIREDGGEMAWRKLGWRKSQALVPENRNGGVSEKAAAAAKYRLQRMSLAKK